LEPIHPFILPLFYLFIKKYLLKASSMPGAFLIAMNEIDKSFVLRSSYLVMEKDITEKNR
jgi:hypothetical protein